jgi:YD repeat-containing protein
MLDITQQKGTITELHCILDLTNLGIRCLTPVDDSSKYDIVADVNGEFIRIQCKTSSWAKDTAQSEVAFGISTCCQTTNTKTTIRHKYSKADIDYFYTWFNGQGYLVSIEEATGSTFRWRYEYPQSGQKQGIHIANDYKIEEVLKTV